MAKAKSAPKKDAEIKVAAPKKAKARVDIFSGIRKELLDLGEKYRQEAATQSGGTAQRINRASKDLARMAKLFV